MASVGETESTLLHAVKTTFQLNVDDILPYEPNSDRIKCPTNWIINDDVSGPIQCYASLGVERKPILSIGHHYSPFLTAKLKLKPVAGPEDDPDYVDLLEVRSKGTPASYTVTLMCGTNLDRLIASVPSASFNVGHERSAEIVICRMDQLKNAAAAEGVETCMICATFIVTLIGSEQSSKQELLRNLHSLFVSGAHTDIELISMDGERIKAHKGMLAARSPYFETMFSIDMLESSTKEVTIKEIGGNVLKSLVTYIYTGEIPDDDEVLLVDLMKTADYMNMESLKDDVERALSLLINSDNALALYVIAGEQGCTVLLENVQGFIDKNMATIRQSAAFKDMLSNWKESSKKRPPSGPCDGEPPSKK